MNKNQGASASASVSKSSSAEHVGQQKKTKRKHSKIKLPTPPPDPNQETDDVLEYLETLQKIGPHQLNLMRTNSIFTPAIATEDAFDHLEKLYKLMEQMLLLRDQNAKLHRRVRDLEHLRNLQNMQKCLDENAPEVNDVDTAFAENLLDTILSDTKRDPKLKAHHHQPQFRLRQSLLRRQRNRSNSVSLEKNPGDLDRMNASYRRSSALSGPDKKVSKWTKVKAAFKWEKASQNVSDVKSQDSGIGGMQPVNFEVTRYLRVPSTSEDPRVSPSDSGAAEISTPGTISSASSTEDVFCPGHRDTTREDSSEDDQSFTLDYIPNLKDDHSKSPTGKSQRTTWARMKDIIQPRNSLKKSNRLSVKSDDSRLEDATLSDEDVFESKDSKSPLPSPKSLNAPGFDTEHFHFEANQKYQHPAQEETHQAEQSSPKPENLSKLQEEIQNNYRELQTKLSLEFQDKMKEWEKMKHQPASTTTSNISTALSPEEQKEQAFKKKMEEWEKIKGQPKHNMQLQSEEHLPLEFRKKLQEWQKIKKGVVKDDASSVASSPKKKLGEWPKWKSVGGHRAPEFSPLEAQRFSEDFIKKLEAWKQIKSNSYSNEDDVKGNKTPSPKLNRKEGSGRQSKKIKEQTEKELQWFEKELTKIEREKQRLERERQKFLEREERLSKLRRSVMGPNKQNILVQTPSGFYRFEGISRKFTQKLYEWEKAQGIGPEASTFALLSNAYVPTISSPNKYEPPPRLMKCKSADSVMNSELNLTHPLLSQQPSSLSLNDVENLEKECLLNNTSSVPDIIRSDQGDAEEPEAVIVEVEDIIEETASPLEFFMEKKQIPVYQHQEVSHMCEGAAKVTPAVQRSESTRAQINYNLIQDVIDLLRLLSENEDDIRFRENRLQSEPEEPLQVETLKSLYVLQSETSGRLIEKLVRLQEANVKVTSSIAEQERQYTSAQMLETLDSVQDLSVDLLHLAEKLHTDFMDRNAIYRPIDSKQTYPNVVFMLKSSNAKILELRRVLSYLCAASDSTAPGKKKRLQRSAKGLLRKASSKDRIKKESLRESSLQTRSDQNDSDENLTAEIAQGAIKKRFRYKQKGYSSKALDESDDEEISRERRSKRTVARSSNNDETSGNKNYRQEANSNIKLDFDVIQKVAVPTKMNYMTTNEALPQAPKNLTNTPVQVFVKTTRKLFTPLITSSFATESRRGEILETPNVTSIPLHHADEEETRGNEKVVEEEPSISYKPPILPSPTTQRKINKEISPNIRLMLARYNQKIQEQDASNLCKSGGSSGSSSPIWRSPVTNRRVKTQTERYQQEITKLSSPLARLGGDVQKSASLGVVNQQNQLGSKEKPSTKSILKSISACALAPKENSKKQPSKPSLSLKLAIDNHNSLVSPESRSYKLQRAKEEFFNAPLCPISAPIVLESENLTVKYPERNRLSQISVESESSSELHSCEGLLIKSASVGMISVDPETYRQINPEIHGGGYVSLPRDTKKRKEGLMSNLASKFRKVKMRRSKEPKGNKMNTISTLCRQSLVVDINPSLGSQETLTAEEASGARKDSLTVPSDSRGSSSGDTSPSTSRSGSWIKKPRLFKPKQ